MNDVFISYAREDNPIAARLQKMLEAEGLTVFNDQSALITGEGFSERTLNELIEARAVVVLLSSNSKQDKWVREELRGALEANNGYVIPFLLDENATNNWIWPLISDHNAIRVTSPKRLNEAGQVIKHFVRQSYESGEVPEPPSPRTGMQRWQRTGSFLSVISRFKFGIIGTVLLLTLAVSFIGQYYQTGYATRIGITEIWETGHTADTQYRIDKFVFHYRQWKQNPERAENSLSILIDPNKLFDGKVVRNDSNLAGLLASDVEEKVAVDSDYTEAALKYRTAIIQYLNTAEAVKATIQAKPWFMKFFKKSDPLEEKYKYLITQMTEELSDFIQQYRRYTNPRPIPAWSILTEDPLDDSN